VQLLHTLTNKRNDAEYTAMPRSFGQPMQRPVLFSTKIRKRPTRLRRYGQRLLWRGRIAAHAHWRSVKHVDVFTEEGEEEGETIIRRRERFSHELTLAYAKGNIVELKETKEGNKRDEECT